MKLFKFTLITILLLAVAGMIYAGINETRLWLTAGSMFGLYLAVMYEEGCNCQK